MQILFDIITKNVKIAGDNMNDAMSQREQQYYLAVFKASNIMEISCKNKIKLFQFADVHCKTSNDSLNQHKQWCHEITFVYSGKGDIIHNGHKQSIKSGQIHLCFDEDMHQIIPSKSSPLRFYCIGFTLDKSNPLTNLLEKVRLKINSENSILTGCSDLQGAFQSVLSALYSEEQNDVTTSIITNTLNYIISAVLNGFLNNKQEKFDNISMKESLLFYIVSYLRNNVYNIDALRNLSEDTGYSYSYLSHLFSQKMGQSLKDFFSEIRMDAADEMLLKKSVTEVSDILGYSSVHAFTRAYKTARNSTPSSMRSKTENSPIT